MVKPNVVMWSKIIYLLYVFKRFHSDQTWYSCIYENDKTFYPFPAWETSFRPGTWMSLLHWEIRLSLFPHNLCVYTSNSEKLIDISRHFLTFFLVLFVHLKNERGEHIYRKISILVGGNVTTNLRSPYTLPLIYNCIPPKKVVN